MSTETSAAADACDSSQVIDRLVERAGRLYSLPAVAMQVVALTNEPQVDARAVRECIELDPALTTRILRVVNSSLFGLTRQVSDLGQALSLLGVKPLKLLVLGFNLPDKLFVGLAADQLGRYWRRTLTKAVAARELATAYWRRDGDEAIIAGLLGDLGTLLLFQELGEPYANFLTVVQSSRGDLLELERAAVGFDHVDLTARMLQEWRLPPIIVRAVAAGGDVERIERLTPHEKPLAQILHLAELVARLLVDQTPGTLASLRHFAGVYARLSEVQLADFVAGLQANVERFADVLSLQLPVETRYVDVLAAAHAQLAAAADEVVADVVRVERARAHPSDVESQLLAQTQSLSDASVAFLRPAQYTAPALPAPRAFASSSEFAAEIQAQVAQAVNLCRQRRWPLSLALVAWDDFNSLIFHRGPDAARRLAAQLRDWCEGLDHAGGRVAEVAPGQCVVMLPDCDRMQARALADQLIQTSRNVSPSHGPPATVSVGVATVTTLPKGFPPTELLRAAARCLSGARTSGGNVLKSIGVC